MRTLMQAILLVLFWSIHLKNLLRGHFQLTPVEPDSNPNIGQFLLNIRQQYTKDKKEQDRYQRPIL